MAHDAESDRTVTEVALTSFRTGVEIDLDVANTSRKNIAKVGASNIEIYHQDGGQGLIQKAPFDRINVACRCDGFPGVLLDQLKIGGRMLVPIQEETKVNGLKIKNELLYLVDRESEYEFNKQPLWNVYFVPMVGGVKR